MDPFTIALATFGVQKLRGKSTKRSLRDALFAGGLGQLGGMAGVGGLKSFGTGQIAGNTIGQQFMNTAPMRFASSINPFAQKQLPGPDVITGGNSSRGISRLSEFLPKSTAGKVSLFAGSIPLLSALGDDEVVTNQMPAYNKNYKKLIDSGFAGTPTGFMTRAYNADGSFSDTPLEDASTYQSVEEILDEDQKPKGLKTGGIANIQKFNEGGHTALPSKASHDEKDPSNYVRAHGYVTDAAGVGDENEDTMLAQLADGEFVSRSAAVRGAGILAGASVSNREEQRKKGAEFFYEQQSRFKRIMDLLDASRKDN